jgi:hypothetical protein
MRGAEGARQSHAHIGGAAAQMLPLAHARAMRAAVHAKHNGAAGRLEARPKTREIYQGKQAAGGS